MGVMSTLTLLYTFVPSALELWGPKIDTDRPEQSGQVPDEREQNHRRRMGGSPIPSCAIRRLFGRRSWS